MQNVKDNFYIALRNRLAMLNPNRVISVRGCERPAILVEEAESPMAERYSDTYVVKWTQLVRQICPSLIGIACEIHYMTGGSQSFAGLDRGRSMTELDEELATILNPMCVPGLDFTAMPPMAASMHIFWTEPVFGLLETVRDQLRRKADVTVFALGS